MELLASRKFCTTCGSPLSLDMLSGFCPGCLLKTVLETEDESVAGTRIEDYELLNEVARGGMGIVYRARQHAPARMVALKMILPTHLGSSGAVERFRSEAEAAASLDHEAILPIYAVGEHDGAPFYSMKFAEGGTLAARIDRYRDKPREAALLLSRLARAVAYAHGHGLLHRDLKPANVLFDAADKPHISDFGLAKWLQRECDLTQTLAILGTPFYMAPEQATDSRTVTGAADIYSLGAILYHLLTGEPPVSGRTPVEALQQAAAQTPKRPRLTNNEIPSDLETICLKCLEKEAEARYPSADALSQDLDRFLVGRTILARPAGLTNRAWRWTRRNPGVAGFAASTIALLILLVALAPTLRNHTAAPATKSVAILPFDHPGADQTGELLATGLQDDILVSLSKIRDLKVISRNSVARYAGKQTDPAEIGRTLGVDALLIGSLRQTGKQARVNVELLRTADGTQLWAESFDRELEDLFAIESDLALQVASALKATVLPREASGIRHQPTRDPHAYILYVRASDLFNDPDKPRLKLERAEQFLQQAVERDPKFALAFALLSRTKTTLADMYEPATTPRFEEAKKLAERALQIDPDLPEAHMAMGCYLWLGQQHISTSNVAGAARELEVAARNLPNNPELLTLLGRLQREQGKWREALANVEKAAALDPNDATRWDYVYDTNFWMRRYPAALRAVEREIALTPNSWRCEWLRAWTLMAWKGDLTALENLRPEPAAEREIYTWLWFNTNMMLRRYDEAEAIVKSDPRDMLPGLGPLPIIPKSFFLGYVYQTKRDEEKARESFEATLPIVERAAAESPLDPGQRMALAAVFAGLHRKEDAIREGKRACELMPVSRNAIRGNELLIWMAFICLRVDEPELAISLLEESVSTPAGSHVGQLSVSPIWETLRNNPRFQRLLTKYAQE